MYLCKLRLKRKIFGSRSIFLGLLGLFFLSVTIFLYWKFFFNNNFYNVLENRIYRSAQPSVEELNHYIDHYKIKTIINLRGKFEHEQWYRNEKNIAQAHKINFESIRFNSNDLPRYFFLHKLVNTILFSEKPILLHCQQGVDRAGFASAVSLALLTDLPYADIKKQCSIKFGLLPFQDSIGPLFLSRYEDWLKYKKSDHSKHNFRDFLENGYIDKQGNLEFYFETVNDKLFDIGEKKNETFRNRISRLPNYTKKILIKGWVLDTQTRKAIKNLYLVLNGKEKKQIIPAFERFDVIDSFGLSTNNVDLKVGWQVEFALPQPWNECLFISLLFTDKKLVKPIFLDSIIKIYPEL